MLRRCVVSGVMLMTLVAAGGTARPLFAQNVAAPIEFSGFRFENGIRLPKANAIVIEFAASGHAVVRFSAADGREMTAETDGFGVSTTNDEMTLAAVGPTLIASSEVPAIPGVMRPGVLRGAESMMAKTLDLRLGRDGSASMSINGR